MNGARTDYEDSARAVQDAVLEAYEVGISAPELADLLGVSPQRIHQLRRAAEERRG